jgi:hypothetical protein
MNDQGGDVSAEMLDRAFLRPAGRGAVAAQVAGDHFVALRKELDLMAPVFVAAQEAMHENQGRGAAPLADEVQAYSSAPAAGLCAATSFCWSCGGAGS